jgi:hypothetical protein
MVSSGVTLRDRLVGDRSWTSSVGTPREATPSPL